MTAPAIIRIHNAKPARAQIHINPNTGIDETQLANSINAILKHDQVRAVYTQTYNMDNRVYIIDVDSDDTIGTLVFQ